MYIILAHIKFKEMERISNEPIYSYIIYIIHTHIYIYT
jgi:hypothetical protein